MHISFQWFTINDGEVSTKKLQPHCCISYGSIDGGSGSGDTDTVAKQWRYQSSGESCGVISPNRDNFYSHPANARATSCGHKYAICPTVYIIIFI